MADLWGARVPGEHDALVSGRSGEVGHLAGGSLSTWRGFALRASAIVALSAVLLVLTSQGFQRRLPQGFLGGRLLIDGASVDDGGLQGAVDAGASTLPAAFRNPDIAMVNKTASPTLYCYMVVMVQTVERWLVLVQLEQGTGIFGCNGYTVFSDEPLEVGLGPSGPVEARAIPGDTAWLAPVEGSRDGVWHNTGVFARAWEQLRQEGRYELFDWTVKVDPDTVFFPGTLQKQIHERFWLDAAAPSYFLNCGLWRSLQGPLEIASRGASRTFLAGVGTCLGVLDWKSWGEDWFVQHCMDELGVQAQAGYDMLDDMWCDPAYSHVVEAQGPTCNDGRAAFHPYKSVDSMRKCLDEAVGR